MSQHTAFDAYVRYRTGLTISLAVVVIQMLVLVFASKSVGLFEDMVHGVADNLVLIGATIILYFEANGAYPNKGRKRILALMGGVLLILAGTGGAWIAYERIFLGTQVPLSGLVLACTSLVAVIGGGFAFWVIHGVDKDNHDHLHTAAIAHLVGDLAISVVVFISSIGIIFFGLSLIDSWIALTVISPWMFYRGIQILKYKDPPENEHAVKKTKDDGHHHHGH